MTLPPLTISASNVTYLPASAAVPTTVEKKLRLDLPFSPFDFGAVGNKVTDDTGALAAMAKVLNSLCDNLNDATLIGNYPRLEFPRCAGFKTRRTLTLNASIEIVMHSPLWVAAPAEAPIVGLHYKDFSNKFANSPRDRAPVFDVRRLTRSNWASEADIGVLIDSVYSGRLTFKRTDGFTVGFDACLGYGEATLGDHRQNQRCYIRARGAPAVEQFTNHLAILRGSFVNDGAGPGLDRYGLVIEGVNPFGANTILLDGQSYELARSSAGEADAIPLVIDGSKASINSVRAINQRSETNGAPFARVVGTVRNVEIGIMDAELEYLFPTSQLLDDQSDGGGSISLYRHHGASGPLWKDFFTTGRLADKAVMLTDGSVAVQNMETARDVGAAPAQQTFAYGTAGPTFDASGYMTAPDPFVGVRVKLNGERSLGIVGLKPAGKNVDVRVICFDAAGTQITAVGAVQLEQSAATLMMDHFGGYYTVGVSPVNAATAFEGVLAFSGNVDTAFIAVSTPVSGFTLKSLGGRAQWFSATAHLKDDFVGGDVPIAFANVAYKRGARVHNIAPTTGGPEGWVLVDQPAAGAAGSWKTFGSIAS
jgi:hypothetical protein